MEKLGWLQVRWYARMRLPERVHGGGCSLGSFRRSLLLLAYGEHFLM
jgi:hypothetical protein